MTGLCSHCGERVTLRPTGMIGTHDFPKPCRSVCPGSGQSPKLDSVEPVPLPPTEYAKGLRAAVEIAEWGHRTPAMTSSDTVKAFAAGIDYVLIFLRGAAARAERGEDYRSLSKIQEVKS